jgi:hypothetical protein
MTVNTTSARVEQNGDGSTSTFAVPFYFLEADDLLVYLGGQPQSLVTHYSVSGAGNAAGGSVTFVTAPPAGTGNVVIIRDPDLLQSTRYPANDPFPAKTHETALDKLTMLVQRTRDLINRSFRLSDSDTSGASLSVPAPQAGYLIGWNDAGNGLSNFANTGGGSTLPLPVGVNNGGTGANNAATARANLGIVFGTAAGNVPQLDASSRLANSTLKHPTAARSSNTILGAADNNTAIKATGTFTQTFTAAATLGDGWHVFYRNDGTGIVTLDPNGAELIDGVATLNLYPGEGCMVVCDGAAFKTYGRSTGLVLTQRQVISSPVTSVDLTQGINADFDEHVLVVNSAVPATDDAVLQLRVSDDGGATFKSGTSDYLNTYNVLQNGVSNVGYSGNTYAAISQSCSSTSTDGGVNGEVRLFSLYQNTKRQHWIASSSNFRTATSQIRFDGSHRWNGASLIAINCVRVMFASGSIASGTIALYGVRKT